MTLTLLHTSDAHCATFDALCDVVAPKAKLRHVVRPVWLERAQGGVDARLEAKIRGEIAAAPGQVMCTCTTIGPVAAKFGAMRIDWPMMQKAARADGPIMMAYCLDSTFEPSLALLNAALAELEQPKKVHPLPLTQYWPLFEAGEVAAFNAVIAGEIRQVVQQKPDLGVVVLAQASMAGAATYLQDIETPVLSSPELALRRALDL